MSISAAENPASAPALVVLGADCLTGLQISRIAWRRGIAVIGVAANPQSPYCRSRSFQRLCAAGEFAADPLRCLEDGGAIGAKPVLLACTDDFAWWIEAQQASLRRHFDFLFPPPGVLARLADKRGFHHHALALGLPVPETWFAENVEELAAAMPQMSYPLVLKPIRKTEGWERSSGGNKVLKVSSSVELEQAAQKLLPHGGLVMQRWIEGPDEDTREVSLCLDPRQVPIAAIALRKIRQWPPGAGTGSLAESIEAPDLLATATRILTDLDFVGPAQVEFKLERASGRYYLIEVNAGRVALNFPLFEALGIEMTMQCYLASRGIPTTTAENDAANRAKWICWKRDLPAALALWRQGQLTLAQWLRSLAGPRFAADIDWSDPVPMLADLGQKSKRILKRGS